jgi:hypothetical protein
MDVSDNPSSGAQLAGLAVEVRHLSMAIERVSTDVRELRMDVDGLKTFAARGSGAYATLAVVKVKLARRDTVAKIEVHGGKKAEIEMPSQAEFDGLRAGMIKKINSGEISFMGHVAPDQIAAAVIGQIVNAGQGRRTS